jgi:hypothetical protein
MTRHPGRQSVAHRGFDLAAGDADVAQHAIVEPLQLANGAADASLGGRDAHHPNAARGQHMDASRERLRGAAHIGSEHDPAREAGLPLDVVER